MAKFGRLITGLAISVATIGAGVGIGLLGAAPAGAATLAITVTDAGDGAGPFPCTSATTDCSLRAAITMANLSGDDAVITVPDANTVPFNPSKTHTYSLNAANGELFLFSSHTITINGAGASLAILQMNASTAIPSRVLHVGSTTTAVISGITVEGGVLAGTTTVPYTGPGGAGILNAGILTLSNSTVTGNTIDAATANSSGGGVYLQDTSATLTSDTITNNSAPSAGGLTMESGSNVISGGAVDSNNATSNASVQGEGGGVVIEDLNAGDSASLSNVNITGNGAADDGGGMYVGNQGPAKSNNQVTLTNVNVDLNSATGDAGGGMYVANDGPGVGTVTMTGGSVSGNTSASEGGGVYDMNNANGAVHFTNVSVNSNTASIQGGGLYVQGEGTGDTTTFSGGSIDNNSVNTSSTNGLGGGLFLLNNGTPSTVSFSGGSISGNKAYEGGGVSMPPGSFPSIRWDSAIFTNETVSGNHATESGGGFSDNAGAVQPLTIASSTISGNSADSNGGGIFAFAPPSPWTCDLITLTNDTITGNTAVDGGGYYGASCATTPASTTTSFKFDTISGNTATSSSGAGNIQVANGDTSKLTLADSIVANGSASGGAATNCLLAGSGSFTSGGYNLIDNSNCGSPAATDIIGKNPQLGALGNNGGPTQTELPAAASPAVGAIPSGACSATGVGSDQRGNARGAGISGSCTIGSVEVAQTAPPPVTNPSTTTSHGYWLVGSDGGIFSFDAPFFGSTGSLVLQRPVVGIVATKDHGGYWLDASDGGVFSFGDTAFYGSIPGLGIHPYGSGLPKSLNAPVVGMVPSADQGGYFMVASDGGVFAFGDAKFAGSCYSVGGCAGAAVAVMPDASGKGYWVVTQTGNVYGFGDAPYFGGPGNTGSPVTSAVRTPSGNGYWVLTANGNVYAYGDALNAGGASGAFGGINPANAIFTTSDNSGYWIASANGSVMPFGGAPNNGSMVGTKLNGPIIAATGF